MQQGRNSLLNTTPTSSSSQIPLPHHHHHHHHPTQIQNHPHFPHDPASSSSSDDFLDQMLSTIPPPSPWSDLNDTTAPAPSLHDDHAPSNSNNANPSGFHAFDESSLLASKLRQHQISSTPGTSSSAAAVAKIMLQQQLLMAASSGVPQNGPLLDGSPFNSPSQGGEMQALYNGFASGSLPTTGQQHFHHPQAQNFGVMNQQQQQHQASGSTSGGGGAPAQQPKQRVRARRGQATDPHSIAERLRRERIAERMKALQELVPNANKTDKASMLDEIIDYVKFLQLQVKVLSMSRLGGAAAVAPLVADMSSEGVGGGDCIQAANGGSLVNQTASSGDNITVTEHQVAKLMEEDMGSAMQYLQGKGLCLMPISLATAISTVTCPSKNSLINGIATVPNSNGRLHQPNGGEGPASPNISALTVQSATVSNGVGEGAIKDAASISKP